MAIKELDRMRAQVNKSEIAEGDEKHFLFLLDNYRRDFLALVSQNDRILRLSGEMLEAVTEIVGLVEGKVADAEQAMTATRLNIDSVTARNEHAMLWVVVIATLLGLFLAYAITVSIVGPLLRMAGLLDRLAAEEPAERMPFFAGGRDEVNLMAGSVNAMADHKAGFIDWWKATMREADACERLQDLVRDSADPAQLAEAQAELSDSRWEKEELLQEQHRSIYRQGRDLARRRPAGISGGGAEHHPLLGPLGSDQAGNGVRSVAVGYPYSGARAASNPGMAETPGWT
jgi:HAMP domain-containing protein